MEIAFEKVIKSHKSADLVGVANQKMILLFADNITSGDPSIMSQMVCAQLKYILFIGSPDFYAC